jgi:hypothetical protein
MSSENDSLASFGATTNNELTVNPGPGAYWLVLASECSPAFLLIQNVSTVPIFYRLNKDWSSEPGGTNSGNYTGVLAAGLADNDGAGGVITLAGYTGGIGFNATAVGGTVNIAYSGRLGE